MHSAINHSVYTLCRWFEGFDWEGLQKRTMIPPIIPNVSCFSCLLVQGKLGCCWIIHWFIYPIVKVLLSSAKSINRIR